MKEDFIRHFLFDYPAWIGDSCIRGISRELKKKNLEIVKVLRRSENEFIAQLSPKNKNVRYSGIPILYAKRSVLPIYPTEWRIMFISKKDFEKLLR